MRDIRTDSIVRTAYSNRINARIFNHSAEQYVLAGDHGGFEYVLNRYMVMVPDAYFIPRDRFVMDRATKSIIAPEMVSTESDPALGGFGKVVEFHPDGRSVIDFTDCGRTIQGPVICVSPWTSFSARIAQILMGILHCDDLLETATPILVPEDLTMLERQALALIGVPDDRLVKVPRNTAVRVTNALVPSKSYARSMTLATNRGLLELGYFLEPNDLRALNRRIRARLEPRADQAPVVFIARADAGARFVTNELEIVDALEKFGVRYIRTTETPIETTCQAIMDARVVVSGHGSGLMNFVAADSATTLIEIDHVGNDWLGRAICRVLGAKYRLAARPDSALRDFSNYTDRAADVGEVVGMVAEELGVQPR
jgi:hypothetical protein